MTPTSDLARVSALDPYAAFSRADAEAFARLLRGKGYRAAAVRTPFHGEWAVRVEFERRTQIVERPIQWGDL